ncbi:hypothetical protein BU14_0371s0003 [Porphyra umbilicalis]|uniref:Histone deacetylase complex subunit SAP30 Sin3 binding domain-containing protein n=1 Tax=Porphyra umbilicalis TaxID=2786 RepID=A0A1X6NX01_PORUM|nr:hypothetical protein BU14_0371s0003 [Porphyra umbilicalis]|eukprot:OSX73169.1 hypothetical protein BU14_0371s0003 [Porphyra umbilicalis]
MTSKPRGKAVAAKDKTGAGVPRPYVDLSKLHKNSLKRYLTHFGIEARGNTKVELLKIVTVHFAQMPVQELAVARDFHNFTRSDRGKRVLEKGSANLQVRS